MDRSYLSQRSVITASRDFVCVRLATYEDASEADFLRAFTPTRSGQLENTVFGILAPDGTHKLIRSSRGPDHLFNGPQDMAKALIKIAANYPGVPTPAPAPLPLVAHVKLAINVAAADNLPLVVVTARDADQRKILEERLAVLAWKDEFIGHFVFASGTGQDLAALDGVQQDAALVIAEPEQFGRSARVMGSLPADASSAQIARLLRAAVSQFTPMDKTFVNHVREGQRRGIFWEPATPVTDPMEIRARERGKNRLP